MGHYVYKYVNRGEIIYIGKCDSNLTRRLQQHCAPYDNVPENAWDDMGSSEIYYIEVDSAEESEQLETELIRKYHPKYNRQKQSNMPYDNPWFTEPIWKRHNSLLTKRQVQAYLKNAPRITEEEGKLLIRQTFAVRVLLLKTFRNDNPLNSFILYWDNIDDYCNNIQWIHYPPQLIICDHFLANENHNIYTSANGFLNSFDSKWLESKDVHHRLLMMQFQYTPSYLQYVSENIDDLAATYQDALDHKFYYKDKWYIETRLLMEHFKRPWELRYLNAKDFHDLYDMRSNWIASHKNDMLQEVLQEVEMKGIPCLSVREYVSIFYNAVRKYVA